MLCCVCVGVVDDLNRGVRGLFVQKSMNQSQNTECVCFSLSLSYVFFFHLFIEFIYSIF